MEGKYIIMFRFSISVSHENFPILIQFPFNMVQNQIW